MVVAILLATWHVRREAAACARRCIDIDGGAARWRRAAAAAARGARRRRARRRRGAAAAAAAGFLGWGVGPSSGLCGTPFGAICGASGRAATRAGRRGAAAARGARARVNNSFQRSV
jgi:hypothetical protein